MKLQIKAQKFKQNVKRMLERRLIHKMSLAKNNLICYTAVFITKVSQEINFMEVSLSTIVAINKL